MTDDGQHLVVPGSGELVPYDDPHAVARALHHIDELQRLLREAKDDLSDVMKAEFERVGTQTLRYGPLTAKLSGGYDVHWDVGILEELRDAGLPEDRFDQLVTAEVTYKVNGQIANQLAGANDQYREIIERARTRVPKKQYVGVK